tara:strand:+ start:554 stop:808 length:255 start_codon:yes stop_codon:yes gene_type:complete
MTQNVKIVYVAERQDPLIDLSTLTKIGRHASRSARDNALRHGVGFTYAKKGKIIKVNPDGSEQLIRTINNIENFPTLEADLCQG